MASNPPPPQGRLPVLVNLASNERHALNSSQVTIGRAPNHFIVLADDEYASGNHAKVYFKDGGWFIEDTKSSNGTRVNDIFITEPQKLAPGNIIQIGHTKFRIE
jgi:pSer/pThr/pTyr-binding forkhead associated (FHA) protein